MEKTLFCLRITPKAKETTVFVRGETPEKAIERCKKKYPHHENPRIVGKFVPVDEGEE